MKVGPTTSIGATVAITISARPPSTLPAAPAALPRAILPAITCFPPMAYPVTVKAQNNEGLFAATFTVTVNEVDPSMDPLAVDSPFKVGSPVDLGEIGFDDLDTRDTHSATVSWGDGATNVGTVSRPRTAKAARAAPWSSPSTLTTSRATLPSRRASRTRTVTASPRPDDQCHESRSHRRPVHHHVTAKEGDTIAPPPSSSTT